MPYSTVLYRLPVLLYHPTWPPQPPHPSPFTAATTGSHMTSSATSRGWLQVGVLDGVPPAPSPTTPPQIDPHTPQHTLKESRLLSLLSQPLPPLPPTSLPIPVAHHNRTYYFSQLAWNGQSTLLPSWTVLRQRPLPHCLLVKGRPIKNWTLQNSILYTPSICIPQPGPLLGCAVLGLGKPEFTGSWL